jgi:ribosome biogenesis GTPase A
MVCRNKERGEEALKQLAEETGSSNLVLEVLDVSRPNEIRNFAKSFIDSGRKLVIPILVI